MWKLRNEVFLSYAVYLILFPSLLYSGRKGRQMMYNENITGYHGLHVLYFTVFISCGVNLKNCNWLFLHSLISSRDFRSIVSLSFLIHHFNPRLLNLCRIILHTQIFGMDHMWMHTKRLKKFVSTLKNGWILESHNSIL